MRSILPLLVILLLLAGGMSAQTPNFLSYPQDTVGGGWRTMAALGCEWENNPNPGDWDEGRYQMLIPATHLPSSGGLLAGIAGVNMSFVGTLTYSVLNITVSHTTATALGNAFQNNLPTPVACLSGTNFKAQYYCCPTMMWGDPILFTKPFPYDGKSNLVIEFQKVLDRKTYPLHMSAFHRDNEPGRKDLPQPIAAWGKYGSGAHQAATAMTQGSLGCEDTPMSIRLFFIGVPTLSVRSDRGGTSNKVFGLGAKIDFSIYGNLNSAYMVLFDIMFMQPPVSFAPLVQGASYIFPIRFNLGLGIIPTTGPGTFTVPIPNDPVLGGYRIVMQGVVVDPSFAAFFTNAADALINP